MNKDTDNDGKCDLNCDTNNDGIPDKNIDVDGDEKCDLNCEDDACDLNCDIDGDGKPDINIDVDNDGICDYECDSDGDGQCDYNCDVTIDITKYIEFTDIASLEGKNILPGWKGTQKFSVKNTSNSSYEFSLVWKKVFNNFINKNDLIYTVKINTNGKDEIIINQRALPSSNETIIDSLVLEPYRIYYFTIEYEYINQDYEQADQGKTFNGSIQLELK